MDVARCMLEGVVLPEFLWVKDITTVVFLLNRQSSKIICGETPYYRMFNRRQVRG